MLLGPDGQPHDSRGPYATTYPHDDFNPGKQHEARIAEADESRL